ncbi:MAG: hypothetical protein V1874_17380, partial [Spirochaetota bacterium]
QQNAAAAEELSSTAEMLSTSAQDLQELVSFFRTKEDTTYGKNRNIAAKKSSVKKTAARADTEDSKKNESIKEKIEAINS